MSQAARFGLRSVRVPFEVYEDCIVCVVGPSENVQRYVRWKFDDPDIVLQKGSTDRGWTFLRRGYVPVIWLPRKPRNPTEIGTLAHEVLHAVSNIMARIGVPLTEESDEAYCHAVGYAVRTILTKLR